MKTAMRKAPQFVVNAKGEQVGVLLDVKTYERLREAQEELADIAAYKAAAPKVHAEIARGEFFTLRQLRRRSRARK